jgi:hypothetical protein
MVLDAELGERRMVAGAPLLQPVVAMYRRRDEANALIAFGC